MQTHYDTLKVTRDASAEVIRRAYVNLAKEYHAQPSADKASTFQRLREINTAFDTLKDSARRRTYDASILRGTTESRPTSLPRLSGTVSLASPQPPAFATPARVTQPASASVTRSAVLPPPIPASQSSHEPPPPETSKRSRLSLFLILLGFGGIGFVALLSILIISESNRVEFVPRPAKAPPTRTYNPQFAPPPPDLRLAGPSFSEPEQSAPKHGATIVAPGYETKAPFEIKTKEGNNYFVKLTDLATGKEALTVFVHGGKPLKIEAPLGNFSIKYATGPQWYGYEHLFGPDTAYAKAQGEFVFKIETDSESKPELLRLKKQLTAADQKVKDFLIKSGTPKKTISYIFDKTDSETELTGIDRLSNDWWKKNILSKIKNTDSYNELVDRLNARNRISDQYSTLESKSTHLGGYTISLYTVRDGNLKTSSISKEEF